jgi:hypothetical protein
MAARASLAKRPHFLERRTDRPPDNAYTRPVWSNMNYLKTATLLAGMTALLVGIGFMLGARPACSLRWPSPLA